MLKDALRRTSKKRCLYFLLTVFIASAFLAGLFIMYICIRESTNIPVILRTGPCGDGTVEGGAREERCFLSIVQLAPGDGVV